MSLNEENITIGIDCMLVYADNKTYSVNNNKTYFVNSFYEDLDSFDTILESIISMDGSEYEIGYDSALANHSNEIPDDLKITKII